MLPPDDEPLLPLEEGLLLPEGGELWCTGGALWIAVVPVFELVNGWVDWVCCAEVAGVVVVAFGFGGAGFGFRRGTAADAPTAVIWTCVGP